MSLKVIVMRGWLGVRGRTEGFRKVFFFFSVFVIVFWFLDTYLVVVVVVSMRYDDVYDMELFFWL